MTVFDPKRHGLLCFRHCGVVLPLRVLRSNAGFYIGTRSEEGEPMSRESSYFASRELAQDALDRNCFHQRENP